MTLTFHFKCTLKCRLQFVSYCDQSPSVCPFTFPCLHSSIYKYKPINTKLGHSVYDHKIYGTNQTWPRAYKTFFMLNSAEHEISKLDKSNLINLLEKRLTCGDFHCFCLSNQSFKFNLPYSLKDKLGFKV